MAAGWKISNPVPPGPGNRPSGPQARAEAGRGYHPKATQFVARHGQGGRAMSGKTQMASQSHRQAGDAGRAQITVGIYSYDPADKIGHGSFADVFRGCSPDGKEVAIKRIHQNRLKKSSSRQLLRQEVEILRESQHPNIVRLLEYIDVADHVCLVMEYCNGGDLSTFIDKSGAPLIESTIVQLLGGIADALHCLHGKNILHRDLKPQNILITYEPGQQEPVVKLADFGFARHLEMDLAETFCGSPLYMAPEVLNGNMYDGRADLWSIGAILYQLMTKRPPFKADSIRKLQEKLARRPELDYPPRYSAELREMCEALLQVDPERRIGFDSFFRHPVFVGWEQSRSESPGTAAAESSGVPYGDEPATPSPASSVERDGMVAAVDDRSYVLIDKENVELATLDDDLRNASVSPSLSRRAAAVSATTTGHTSSRFALTNAEHVNLIAREVEEVERQAAAVMDVAATFQCSAGGGRTILAGQSVRPQLTGLQYRDRVELMLLYQMARNTFHVGLMRLRGGLQRLRELGAGGELVYGAQGREAVQNLRKKFDECLRWIEELRAHLPPDLLTGEDEELVHRLGIRPSEEIIYEHAVHLCREAASSEGGPNRDLGAAEVLYGRAIVLFKLLRQQAPADDREILDGFISTTTNRLDRVVGHATAEAQRTATVAGPTEVASHTTGTEMWGNTASTVLGRVGGRVMGYDLPSADAFDRHRSTTFSAGAHARIRSDTSKLQHSRSGNRSRTSSLDSAERWAAKKAAAAAAARRPAASARREQPKTVSDPPFGLPHDAQNPGTAAGLHGSFPSRLYTHPVDLAPPLSQQSVRLPHASATGEPHFEVPGVHPSRPLRQFHSSSSYGDTAGTPPRDEAHGLQVSPRQTGHQGSSITQWHGSGSHFNSSVHSSPSSVNGSPQLDPLMFEEPPNRPVPVISTTSIGHGGERFEPARRSPRPGGSPRVTCPRCSTALMPGQKFCMECGSPSPSGLSLSGAALRFDPIPYPVPVRGYGNIAINADGGLSNDDGGGSSGGGDNSQSSNRSTWSSHHADSASVQVHSEPPTITGGNVPLECSAPIAAPDTDVPAQRLHVQPLQPLPATSPVPATASESRSPLPGATADHALSLSVSQVKGQREGSQAEVNRLKEQIQQLQMLVSSQTQSCDLADEATDNITGRNSGDSSSAA